MTRDFFEASPAKWTLYARDKRRLFAINFYVDKNNERAEFLSQIISVNIYSDEDLVRNVEKSMRDVVSDR